MPDYDEGPEQDQSKEDVWERVEPVATGLEIAHQTGEAVEAWQVAQTALEAESWGLDSEAAVSIAEPSEDGGLGVMNALGLVTGGLTMAKGADELSNGNTSEGGYDLLSGGASVGGAVASMAGGEAVAGGFGAFGSGLQIGKGVAELDRGDAQGAFDVLQGGAGATSAIAGMVAEASPVAPIADAAVLGLTVGNTMAQIADSDATRTGAWGQDDAGHNQSAMDWGANWGTEWDQAHGNTGPSIMGGVAAAAGGIVGGVAGTGQALWNWLDD
jgi:hypothetical protein